MPFGHQKNAVWIFHTALSKYITNLCLILLFAEFSANFEFFAGFELRLGGEAVELAELADGDAVARRYAAECVAAAYGVALRASARAFGSCCGGLVRAL